jgi:hypothetical protein
MKGKSIISALDINNIKIQIKGNKISTAKKIKKLPT